MSFAIQTAANSPPNWLGWAIAAGSVVFILGFMFINRDSRISTNFDALITGEPGLAGIGTALLVAGTSTEHTILTAFGLIAVGLALLAWFTPVIDI